MPAESIIFDPEIDERQLDSETDKVNEAFAETGQVDIEAQGGLGDMGVGGVGDGGGGGGGGGGAAAEAGAAALGEKLPSSVGAVAGGAAKALPVALAGGIGAGLLSKMTEASGAMKTDARLMGIAVDTFFREPGNILSEKVTRPLAKSNLEQAQMFDEALRSGDLLGAGEALLSNTGEQDPLRERIGGALGGAAGLLAGAAGGAKAGAAGGAALGSVVPGAGTAAGGTVGAIIGAITGAIGASQLGNRVGKAIASRIPDFNWPSLPEFSWPNLPTFSWPNIPQFEWPSLPSPPSWPSIPSPPDWSTLTPNLPDWSDLTPDLGGGGGDGLFSGLRNRFGAGEALGGRVQSGGIAKVHRNELIADPDRLVNDLANAMGQTSGGRQEGGTGDTEAMERKLDEVNRNLKRLADSMPSFETVSDGDLARTVERGSQQSMYDADPQT